MVDPVSIIAMVCSVIGALRNIQQWWEERKAKKLPWNQTVDAQFIGGFMAIWSRYNRTAAIIGSRYGQQFDTMLGDTLSSLGPQVKKLMIEHHAIELQSKANEPDEEIEQKRVEKLAKRTARIRNQAENAWQAFSIRLIEAGETQSPENSSEHLIEQPTHSNPIRKFCYGAELQQSGRRGDAQGTPSPSGWGYICKFCKLEVGNYPAVRLSDKEVLESHTLLTASHLVACRSLDDRRAFYRCLPCYQQCKLVDLPSAMALEEHMTRHPGYTLKSIEGEMSAQVAERMEQFLTLGKGSLRTDDTEHGADIEVSSEESGDSDNEDDESTISRDGSSARSEKVGLRNLPRQNKVSPSSPSVQELDTPPSPIEETRPVLSSVGRPAPPIELGERERKRDETGPTLSSTRTATPLVELGERDVAEADSKPVQRRGNRYAPNATTELGGRDAAEADSRPVQQSSNQKSSYTTVELEAKVKPQVVVHEMALNKPSRNFTPDSGTRRKMPVNSNTTPTPMENRGVSESGRVFQPVSSRTAQRRSQEPLAPSRTAPVPLEDDKRVPVLTQRSSQTQMASAATETLTWKFEEGKYRQYNGQTLLQEQNQARFDVWVFNQQLWKDDKGNGYWYMMVLGNTREIRFHGLVGSS